MSTLGFLAILLPCVLGSSIMSYFIGKTEGINAFWVYLDGRKDKDGMIKIRITDDDIEFIK
jgi:hypothetical protein